ncbi:putative transposase, Ptta/En/Spm, plant [Senna tora]|uniref:Putative transposase, Ptta/En/Spm, plant n=1 Tax=Senna tora TaxID=362788 RepID=A0A834XF50_9FABA|nr:putative transposase, Ptta/En/Spm, plant [Senna tora]
MKKNEAAKSKKNEASKSKNEAAKSKKKPPQIASGFPLSTVVPPPPALLTRRLKNLWVGVVPTSGGGAGVIHQEPRFWFDLSSSSVDRGRGLKHLISEKEWCVKIVRPFDVVCSKCFYGGPYSVSFRSGRLRSTSTISLNSPAYTKAVFHQQKEAERKSQLKDHLTQNPEQNHTEAFKEVFGKEKAGRVRCYGRNVTPTALKQKEKQNQIMDSMKQEHAKEVNSLKRMNMENLDVFFKSFPSEANNAQNDEGQCNEHSTTHASNPDKGQHGEKDASFYEAH